MDTNTRKEALLRKYLDDAYSREELEELLEYLRAEDDTLYEEVTARLWKEIGEEKKITDQQADMLIQSAVQADSGERHKRVLWFRWYKVAAAAVVIVLMGAGIRYLTSQSKDQPMNVTPHVVQRYKNDVRPGRTRAILKAGSAQVVLNKQDTSFLLAGNTVNIQEGGVKVAGRNPVQYTLITPKGGQYSLVLSDGTKVWLNADSKLVYPSEFRDSVRIVKLTGEAYFEVKTDPANPFIVHTERQDIRVLGTAFNVQAYPEESTTRTTLVDGAVQVNTKEKQLRLKQGQEAVLTKDGALSLRSEADIEQAIAWKEGYFRFDYTDIYEIMRRLSRWYDVEVKYERGLGHQEFLAFIDRDNNISEVLGMLEETGEIRFAIDGHTVMVMKGKE